MPVKRPRYWWIAALIVILCGLGHTHLLTGLARCLVATPGSHSKVGAALIVSGDRRFEVAAEQLRVGQINHVLLFEIEPRRLELLTVIPLHHEIGMNSLKKLGVPSEQIQLLRGTNRTAAERLATLDRWMIEHSTDSTAILCNQFESRRWQELVNTHVEAARQSKFVIVPLVDRRFGTDDWWKSSDGVKVFFASAYSLAYFYIRGEDPYSEIDWSPDLYEEKITKNLAAPDSRR